jgi:spore germination protein GerM
VEKVTNALEAANYNIRPLHRYVKELDECYERHDRLDRAGKGRASTLYYLSQHLDRQKCKTK